MVYKTIIVENNTQKYIYLSIFNFQLREIPSYHALLIGNEIKNLARFLKRRVTALKLQAERKAEKGCVSNTMSQPDAVKIAIKNV